MTWGIRQTVPWLVAVLAVVALASWMTQPAPSAAQEGDEHPFHLYVPGVVTDALPPARVIGTSVQGRPIEAWTLGEGETTIALLGGLHTGPEAETVTVVRALLEHYAAQPEAIPEDVTLVFVPLINPDGYAMGSRTNANGVDLNRNFPTDDWRSDATGPGGVPENGGPAPLSEPETSALYSFLLTIEPELVIEWHGYAGLVEANEVPAGAVMGHHYAQVSGYNYLEEWEFYPITGELAVEMEELGIGAFDVELALGDGAAIERNIAATQAVIEALPGGSFAQVAGEGNGCVPLREEPAPGSPVADCIALGSLLWTMEEEGTPAWTRVIVAYGGQDGWMDSRLIEAVEPPDWLPQTGEGLDGAQIAEDPARQGGR